MELRKQLMADLSYDAIGESVGFFRFKEDCARRLAEIVKGYVDSGRANMPHEEAVRDLLLERSHVFDTTRTNCDAKWRPPGAESHCTPNY